jgi:hypothetical protein
MTLGGRPTNRVDSPSMQLLKKAVAGAAVAAATELFGKRLYLAYEAMRRLSSAGPREDEEHRPPPTPEQVVEDAVGDLIDRSKQAIERHRPVLERARARTRARLGQPRIAAAVVGGSVLGAVSVLGVLPFTIGAGTAYLVYRRFQREDRRDAVAERPGRPRDDG